MNNFYHVFSRAVSPQVCKDIIKRGLALPAVNGSIGFDADHVDNSYRISTVRWFKNTENEDIVRLLQSFAQEANREHFGFDIFPTAFDLQFTEYNASTKGKYDWHHDVWWLNPRAHDRKLSVVIQLSPEESYTGGNFEFRVAGLDTTALNDFRHQGSVLVFPSFFEHRVTQILTGTRYSLVTWIDGPKFR